MKLIDRKKLGTLTKNINWLNESACEYKGRLFSPGQLINELNKRYEWYRWEQPIVEKWQEEDYYKGLYNDFQEEGWMWL